MVAGQAGEVTGAIIQARMQSTRLPGKVLRTLPFYEQNPLLQWPVDALKESSYITKIVVATSQLPSDDPICDYAQAHQLLCCQGSENDVLSRFIDAIELYQLTTVVRVTGDNPFLDAGMLDKVISEHYRNGADYSYTLGLPTGMNIEVVSAEALKAVSEMGDLQESDREHVTLYVRRSGNFICQEIDCGSFSHLKHLRLTVDYAEDYVLANLLASLSLKNELSGLTLIDYAFSVHPWMFAINQHCYQKREMSDREQFAEAKKMLMQSELWKPLAVLNNNVEKLMSEND